VGFILNRVSDWEVYLSPESLEEELNTIKQYSSSVRHAGNEAFIQGLEELTGRELCKKKPGFKARIK
jgi:hypothetical protein